MTNQLSQVKWARVTLTALVVYILSFLAVLLIVTAYASYLGFQARGAPDQAQIQEFASQYAPWIGPISLILFTFLGAMHMARRVGSALELQGIALGVLVSLINIIFDGLGLGVLVATILTIASGWLGSRLSGKKS